MYLTIIGVTPYLVEAKSEKEAKEKTAKFNGLKSCGYISVVRKPVMAQVRQAEYNNNVIY